MSKVSFGSYSHGVIGFRGNSVSFRGMVVVALFTVKGCLYSKRSFD